MAQIHTIRKLLIFFLLIFPRKATKFQHKIIVDASEN